VVITDRPLKHVDLERSIIERAGGTDLLSMMKRPAYLIKVCRGGVDDEDALADTVRSGIIASAALDTLSRDPSNGNNP